MNRHDNFDFTLVCTVKFYRGKRSLPPDLSSGKYRPHFMIKTDTRYLGVCFIEGQKADFETLVKSLVVPLYEEVDYSGLVCGTEFYIMEGQNKVGEGTIDEIINNR